MTGASARLTATLPRVALGQFPTPLEPAPRLSQALGGAPLWVKREDLSGLALGGNKPRQLEFLLGAALAEGANAVITTAAAQSNFCRACAAAGARLGLKVGLLLRGRPDAAVQGNLLLDKVFGAEIRFIDTEDPYDPRVPVLLDDFASDFKRCGLVAQVLHIPGVTGAFAAAAMVDAGQELAAQFVSRGISPAAVVLAAGSALTAAGLVLAFKALGVTTRVVVISVQRPADFIAPMIVRRAREAAALLQLPVEISSADVEVDDRFIGPGYGVPTTASIEAIALAGRFEGLLLDPIYSGKAMAGLVARVRAGGWAGDAPVVFFHSGGTPGLFMHAAAVAQGLDAQEGAWR